MNKTELKEKLAEKLSISKAAAGDNIDGLIEIITEELHNGGSVEMPGFGKFHTRERAERAGRNPQTGAATTIPAARVAAFKVGKTLKDAVNDK